LFAANVVATWAAGPVAPAGHGTSRLSPLRVQVSNYSMQRNLP
jgi:hypothetical protein